MDCKYGNVRHYWIRNHWSWFQSLCSQHFMILYLLPDICLSFIFRTWTSRPISWMDPLMAVHQTALKILLIHQVRVTHLRHESHQNPKSKSTCDCQNVKLCLYLSGILGGLLRAKTVCATAQQKQSIHYNMHSLYGLLEAKASARSALLKHTKTDKMSISEQFLSPFSLYLSFGYCSALKRILAKRPFVISRSTFPSQGMYSGHWLGDNRSQWKDMYTSIAG